MPGAIPRRRCYPGTLVTVAGFLPVGFARSSAGEYAGNIFWIVGFALIASWVVAVAFTPYLGVKLLPEIKPTEGGHEAIYATSGYRRLRRVIAWSCGENSSSPVPWVFFFVLAGIGMPVVTRQFFRRRTAPRSWSKFRWPEGSSIEANAGCAAKVEDWLKQQPETKIVTSLCGSGRAAVLLFLQSRASRPVLCQRSWS